MTVLLRNWQNTKRPWRVLVTSAENKTQAYVSATSNLPMFNEHIESYMNQMLEITGEQMAQAQGQMEQSAASAHDRGGGKSGTACSSRGDHLGLRIWVIGPVKSATRQVDELVEGIRNNRGDITRRIRVKSGDEVGRLSMAINDLVAQMQTIIRAITESCGHMEEKQTGIISNVEKVNATAEDTTQKLGVMAGGMRSVHGGYRRGATGYRGAGYHGGEHPGGGTGWTQLCGGYQG